MHAEYVKPAACLLDMPAPSTCMSLLPRKFLLDARWAGEANNWQIHMSPGIAHDMAQDDMEDSTGEQPSLGQACRHLACCLSGLLAAIRQMTRALFIRLTKRHAAFDDLLGGE